MSFYLVVVYQETNLIIVSLVYYWLMKKLVYVNRDLKVVENPENAVGVALYLKEEEITDASCLDGLDMSKALVNIALFEPIGHDLSLMDSLALQKLWCQKHYPLLRSTLISYAFYRLSEWYSTRWFGECWTRSRYNEGYPQYRTHPEAACLRCVDADEKLANVYISLVMSWEEFKRINPDVQLQETFE